MQLTDAVQLGRRQALEALRDKLAADIEVAPVGVSAQLAAQLRATLAELDTLDAPAEVTLEDELAARRQDRQPGADAPRRPRRITERPTA
jgi:hypothetical protein